MLYPFSIAISAASNIVSIAVSISFSCFTLNNDGIVIDLNPSRSMFLNFSSSSFVKIGLNALTLRQFNSDDVKRFCSQPKSVYVEVTICSRIASIGGFVACANSCLK